MADKSIKLEDLRSMFDLGEEPEPANDSFVPQRDQKYTIVSYVAYLLGIKREKFGENQNFDEAVYKKLNVNKNARIIRNLCMLRNSLECRYVKILTEYSQGRSVLTMSEYVPMQAVMELSGDGVKLSQKATTHPTQYIVEINTLISDRINNCKQVFPDWIRWDYIRELFIMPNGKTTEGVKTAGELFKNNYYSYPYQAYLNWEMPHENGNILLNDRRFVTLLYDMNFDSFGDLNRVQDVSRKIKGDIYDFIGAGQRVVMIVDCENSDVYNMISMLRGLEWEHLQKIAKIILVNDVHTNIGWNELERCTDIPIEHIMTQRVMDEKSLVDGRVIVSAFTEYYEMHTDSFVLLSSDSDFWTLVDSLREKANLLVMVEHGKVSPDYKEILADRNIYCCYLDDFNSGEESEQMKADILLRTIDAELAAKSFNVSELMKTAMHDLRIQLDDNQRREFYSKHVKTLQMKVDDEGNVVFECKRK